MVEYKRFKIVSSKVEETIFGYEQKITSSQDIYCYIRDIVTTDQETEVKEYFNVIALNSANKIVGFMKVSEGGISATFVDVRLIFKFLFDQLATSFIISHNHPTNNMIPSHSDKELTNKIREGSKYLDIKLLDHIIISGDKKEYYSFADERLL